MSEEPQTPEEVPVPEPEEVERLMKLGVGNPAMQGPMFRLLLAARLWVPIPAHPEMEGGFEFTVGDKLTWCAYQDAEGMFVPVFTTQRGADEQLSKLSGAKPMIAEMPARLIFGYLCNGTNTVRVYASNGANVVLPPEALKSLVEGEFTERGPEAGVPQRMTLTPIRPEAFPSKLLQAIRVFCVQRQGAIAVYAFHPHDPETGEVLEQEYRTVLRLRDNSGHFYNDFSLMMGRSAPRNIETQTAGIEPDDAEGQAFLDRCTPLWPILKGA